MPQETVTWDLRHMPHEPSAAMEAYILFLFIVGGIAAVKLIKAWRVSPPFRLSHAANKPHYLQLLQMSATSLNQWISLTFLGWGIFASVSLYHICDRLLDQERIGSHVILFVVEDFSSALTMALLTATFLFTARWHMLKRVDRLGTLIGKL